MTPEAISVVVRKLKQHQRPLASGFSLETTNRERQFVVTRLQFHVDSASNFNKAFVVWWHHVVFRQVAVLHSNRLKNIKNSLISIQTSNWHITGGCRNLSFAFKREAVQIFCQKSLPTGSSCCLSRLWSLDILRFAVNHEKPDIINKMNQVAVTQPL